MRQHILPSLEVPVLAADATAGTPGFAPGLLQLLLEPSNHQRITEVPAARIATFGPIEITRQRKM